MKIKLDRTYEVATRWSELETDQFISLAAAMEKFELGACGFEEFKIATVAAILRIDLRKTKVTDTLAENFFRIAEKLTFHYAIMDNEGRREVSFRIILDRQMVPEIGKHAGYRFKCEYGIADTSITAEQYVDAISLMQHYGREHNDLVLDRLVSVLYASEPYGVESIGQVNASGMPRSMKVAVYYNFRGILEWIKSLPKYDILYNRAGSASSGSSPMGIEGSIYALAKAGYGTYRDICRLNLFTYLDMLLDQSIESVRTLKGCGLKPVEISEKLHLTIDQIADLL